MSNSSQQRLIAIATVVIIALLGINGYLLYNKITKDRLIDQQRTELIATEKMQAELEKEYYQSLSDLEEMKTSNVELNRTISQQQENLKTHKDRIAVLLKSEKNLAAARTEITRFKQLSAQYLSEIVSLTAENEELTTTNAALTEEKRNLINEVQQERATNEDLNIARTELASENLVLSSEKEALSKKVNIASVIQVHNIEVNGYVLRNSGKESQRKRAKSLDGLKICFATMDNVIAEAGVERFYVRIINPLGETLAIDDMGSGIMTNPNTKDQIRYTQYRDIDYELESANLCMNWQPGLPFNPGNYQVEIYNKGYIAGLSTFSLK